MGMAALTIRSLPLSRRLFKPRMQRVSLCCPAALGDFVTFFLHNARWMDGRSAGQLGFLLLPADLATVSLLMSKKV